MRLNAPLKLVVVLAFTASVVFLAANSLHRTRNATTPTVFEVQPPNPGADTRVRLTIYMESSVPYDQEITVGSTDPQAFLDLPDRITIPANSDSASFEATTSHAFTGWVVLAATSNGGTALAVPTP